MPKLTIEKLNGWYDEAERLDKEDFAEKRTNVLLIAGDHYQKRVAQTFQRTKVNQENTSENQKLRLVKNYSYKIARHYRRSILAYAPGTTVKPQKDTELHDQKSADLNLAVWKEAKYKYRIKEKVREWCHDFVDVGEVAVKVFFDPDRGELQGFAPLTLDDGSEAQDPATGEQVPDEKNPVFKGEFVFERIFAFNLLRCPWSKSMQDSEFLIIRKLTEKEPLLAKYGDDPEKKKFLNEADKDDFIVFDSERGRYSREKKQVLLKEYYWRPCRLYPKGYYAVTTSEGILEEGELPFGIFPVIWSGFDVHATAVRGKSIIRIARPFQAELNRASSQMAMHQITVGDDKILYQSGSKLAPGTLLPGVRGVTYNGSPPQILPGRDGSQFLPYISATTQDMFNAVDLQEINEEVQNGQMDPYTMLFKGINQQKKFGEYNEKFEQFLVDITELYLELARKYLTDEDLIYAIGKGETANIAEFRDPKALCYSIHVEAESETVEELLGRQLTLNHILQYVGNKLEKDDIGKIIRAMPYGNFEEAFSDFMVDYDNIRNDMLAMERGEQPPISPYDNHEYILQRLTKRMKEPDYRYLAPNVKQLYENKFAAHQQILEEQTAKVAAAKNDFIPIGGALIAADMYIPNPKDPAQPAKRVRIPYQALDWLVQRLESQGMTLDKMDQMNQGMVAEMADHIMGKGNPGQTPPTGMPAQAGHSMSPIGVS